MRRAGRTPIACFVAALAVLAFAPCASAGQLIVQPDGKIVVAGQSRSPTYGALDRLHPDGSQDPTFGIDGSVVDHRVSALTALALQPDGRILAGAAGGFRLVRYLTDGGVDRSFAGGRVAGELVAGPEFRWEELGPAAIVVRPGGQIAVGGSRLVPDPQAFARLYDSRGGPIEDLGVITPTQGRLSSGLEGLVELPTGAFVMAGGSNDPEVPGRGSMLLARFNPGAHVPFDFTFGGGEGLVRPGLQPGRSALSGAAAIALHEGGSLFVSGGDFALAKFGLDGTLDPSFGTDGFVVPAPRGPETKYGTRRADALAVAPEGDVLVAGLTREWGNWYVDKYFGPQCTECPQPLIARFDPDGTLDASFGEGGLLRVRQPQGTPMVGGIDEVSALPDGKVVIGGFTGTIDTGQSQFVARLNRDGSYDQAFGEDGLVHVRFGCPPAPVVALRREGCLPHASAGARVHGMGSARPSVSIRIVAKPAWAGIVRVRLKLPPQLEATGYLGRRQVHVVAVGEGGVQESLRGKARLVHGQIVFGEFGGRSIRAWLGNGALRWARGRAGRGKLVFRLSVGLAAAGWGGHQELTVRVGRRSKP